MGSLRFPVDGLAGHGGNGKIVDLDKRNVRIYPEIERPVANEQGSI